MATTKAATLKRLRLNSGRKISVKTAATGNHNAVQTNLLPMKKLKSRWNGWIGVERKSLSRPR
jgi:hypothetical protein